MKHFLSLFPVPIFQDCQAGEVLEPEVIKQEISPGITLKDVHGDIFTL